MDIEEIESYRKAGKIAKQVCDFARSFVKQGMPLIEIADNIDEKIKELGAEPAFPVNLSLNEVAAHYTPSTDDKTIAEGLLKIDLGVCVNGYIADTAFSLDLTEEKKFEEMIKLNEEALNNAISKLNVNSKIKDVGKAIQEVVKNSHFSVIKNLSGHSLGKNKIHAGLIIPNYENENNTELKNMAFAIEPFLTAGSGEVYEGKESEIFILKKDRPVRDPQERELLKFIKENYSTRPFCKRWLEKKNLKNLGFHLKNLTKQGILYNFPVLIEKSKSPVSQAEHTILIADKVEVVTK